MTVKPRRSYEAGHRPKFLVIVDETEECDRAVYFAARRAGRVGAELALLAVISPPEFQHWLGVGTVMEAEAGEEAQRRLDVASACARDLTGADPQLVIRTGAKAEQVLAVIEEDEDIALLVLAASSSPDGPEPLVSGLAGKGAATFPVPIAIVPGGLSDRDIDALA